MIRKRIKLRKNGFRAALSSKIYTKVFYHLFLCLARYIYKIYYIVRNGTYINTIMINTNNYALRAKPEGMDERSENCKSGFQERNDFHDDPEQHIEEADGKKRINGFIFCRFGRIGFNVLVDQLNIFHISR